MTAGPQTPSAADVKAHVAARALQLGMLLARAHGRAATWYASPDRLALDDAQRAAIDAVHEDHVQCLTVRAEWLLAFGAAQNDDHAAACMGAVECVDVHEAWARGEDHPRAAVTMRAKADEARRALAAADAPAILSLFKTGDA